MGLRTILNGGMNRVFGNSPLTESGLRFPTTASWGLKMSSWKLWSVENGRGSSDLAISCFLSFLLVQPKGRDQQTHINCPYVLSFRDVIRLPSNLFISSSFPQDLKTVSFDSMHLNWSGISIKSHSIAISRGQLAFLYKLIPLSKTLISVQWTPLTWKHQTRNLETIQELLKRKTFIAFHWYHLVFPNTFYLPQHQNSTRQISPLGSLSTGHSRCT